MDKIKQQHLTGERALFKSHDLQVDNCVFDDGESPLKESRNVATKDSVFGWKYPLWYCDHVRVSGTAFLEMARAGIWYTNDVAIEDSTYQAPKGLRKCRGVRLENCVIQSEQGLCYVDGLTLRGCKLIETNLAFEYCTNVDAEVTTPIASIKNPRSGRIVAPSIGKIIFDDPEVDMHATTIVTGKDACGKRCGCLCEVV